MRSIALLLVPTFVLIRNEHPNNFRTNPLLLYPLLSNCVSSERFSQIVYQVSLQLVPHLLVLIKEGILSQIHLKQEVVLLASLNQLIYSLLSYLVPLETHSSNILIIFEVSSEKRSCLVAETVPA
jgi:hypothetical protein